MQTDFYYFNKETDMEKKVQKFRQALFSYNQDLIYQYQKKICSQLIYYSKLILINHNQHLLENLHLCITLIKAFLLAKEYDKYCIFSYLMRTFSRSNMNNSMNSEDLNRFNLSLTHKQSKYFRQPTQNKVSKQEIAFIKSDKANNFLIDLTGNEIVLQSTQCVCCTQVFMRDLPIQNANPMIPFFIELNSVNAFDNGVLERNLNAVCNKGGGVIIIGAVNKKGGLKAVGVRFNSQKDLKQKQQFIGSMVKKNLAQKSYLIEKVLVHSTVTQTDVKQVSKQFMCCCFRIIIMPKLRQKLFYITRAYGKDSRYKFYDLFASSSQKEGQEKIIVKIPEIQIYTKIHQKYSQAKKMTRKNSHKNILCSRPHSYYSKIFYKYYNEGLLDLSEIEDEQPQPIQPKQEKESVSSDNENVDFINKNYAYKSVLMVSSAQKDKNVNKFVQCLEKDEQQLQISRPFRNQFLSCVRFVWVLDHQLLPENLKFLLDKFHEQNKIKLDQIIAMTVQTAIMAESSKLDPQTQSYLNHRLSQYFSKKWINKQKTVPEQAMKSQATNEAGESCKLVQSQWYIKRKINYTNKMSHLIKQQTLLKFKDSSTSLYAFMTLEEANIASIFVSEAQATSYLNLSQ